MEPGPPHFRSLRNKGIQTIDQIPAGFLVEAKHKNVRKAVLSQSLVQNRTQLKKLLSQVHWPAYYLDFETVCSCLPFYPNVKPYEQVPTQYSLHVFDAAGHEQRHAEYLADHSRDCRRELTERLLQDLSGRGIIIVYSHFENTVLNALAERFPDLASQIKACQKRIFDLIDVFKSAVYHPGFYGSRSIKKTVPALADLSYDDLAITNGEEAIAAFVAMARGDLDVDEVQQTRQALLAYCKRDTLAMVQLHRKLIEMLSK